MRAVFYYDLVSPEAYLAAERILTLLPTAEWIPVQATGLPSADTLDGFRCATDREAFFDRIERVAARRGLQELRWPDPFPSNTAHAMRTATYACQIGRAVAFSIAAFRQAFAGGHDLGRPDAVLIAAAACEMHPRAVTKATAMSAIAQALEEATALAAQRGVRDVPAVWLPDGRVFHGDDALDGAVRALIA